ncbi:phage tail family protein [bacterium]|nr:phage tail family protein [bacterium]
MVTLGDYAFAHDTTRVLSDLRFVEDRLRRQVEIVGLLSGFSTRAAFESELAALDAAVEAFSNGSAALSLTAGRALSGSVLRYRKTLDELQRSVAFRLILLSEDRFERSVALHEEPLTITASGDYLVLENAGTADSLPTLTLTADGSLVDPSLSDGTRALTYHGTLSAGDVLVVDCDAHTATVNGENALSGVSGDWPRLSPGETTLTYSDDAAGSHDATLVVAYRDFWA